MEYIYTKQNGILVSNKKNNEILPLATTQMALEGIMSEKDKHYMIHLFVESKVLNKLLNITKRTDLKI